MFTGIITDIGTVRRIKKGGDTRMEIVCHYDMSDVAQGASIACNGACLTVTEKTADSFWVSASQETLSKTTLGEWNVGTRINLERALKMGDELGGHIVSGHVDGLAEILSRKAVGDSVAFTIRAPKALAGFIATKGSVTLDGVSLTVNAVEGDNFTVNIIPHTLTHTTIGKAWQEGSQLHLEIDMLARYIARMQEVAA